jgi:hypothetical protein
MSAMLSFADWLLMVVVYLPVGFRASSDHCFRSDYGWIAERRLSAAQIRHVLLYPRNERDRFTPE